MTDREKLVELLRGVQAGGVALDHEALKANAVQNEEVAEYLIAHGVTVREMQKPLTVLDIHEIAIKKPGHKWPFDDVPPILCAEMRNGRMLWVTWGTVVDSVVLGNVEQVDKYNYNNEWRCWMRKPTEEERRNAKWEVE